MTTSPSQRAVSCGHCEHLLAMTGVPNFDYRGRHFLCGFESPLDSNLAGELIGLTDFRPEWCPRQIEKSQKEFEVME